MAKKIVLNVKINAKLKKFLSETCRKNEICLSGFVEDALIDKLEELEDLEDLPKLRKERCRPLSDVLKEMR